MDSIEIKDPQIEKMLRQLIKEGQIGSESFKMEVVGKPGESVYLIKAPATPEYSELVNSVQESVTKLLALMKKHKVHKDVVEAAVKFMHSTAAISTYLGKQGNVHLEMAVEMPKLVKSLDANSAWMNC